MTATGNPPSATVAATPRLCIDFDVFDRECALRGATDESARAELVDIDRVTLWRWRKGKQTPSLEVVTRIAGVFGLAVDDLILRRAA